MLRLIALLMLGVFALPASASAETLAEGKGQGQADYHAWLARSPAARAQVIAFRQFLEMERVEAVLPTWQLVRTASMWRECDGPRFEVAFELSGYHGS